jgi:hypothetical protein
MAERGTPQIFSRCGISTARRSLTTTPIAAHGHKKGRTRQGVQPFVRSASAAG